MKTFRLLLVGVAAVLLLAGCGDGGDEAANGAPPQTAEQQQDLRQMRISMEGYASPPDAGILLADKRGYFADAGIEMTVWGAIRPEYAIEYAAEATDAAVVTAMPEVVRAQAEGEPVVAIGSVLPEATMAMIWLPDSGIDGIADLKGRTIAVPGAIYQRVFLEHVLESAGLSLSDVKLKVVRFNSVYALADGRADAAFGGTWNVTGTALEARGLEPVVTRVTDLGIPDYEELVLTTRRDTFAKDPALYRRIVGAVNRGAVAAEEDPRAGSEAVVAKTLELAPPKPTLAGVEATAPLLSKTGEINEAKLRSLVDWMHEQGMIERRPPLSRLIAGGAQ
jgi:putative hydroxymethylpyrimidine transport system substrate-binding protein